MENDPDSEPGIEQNNPPDFEPDVPQNTDLDMDDEPDSIHNDDQSCGKGFFNKCDKVNELNIFKEIVVKYAVFCNVQESAKVHLKYK